MSDDLTFKVGSIIKVFQKIKEGGKERTVSFKGQVLDIKGTNSNRMFTVRQTIEGVDVDRIFPYKSPTIVKIDVIGASGKRVRRANLVRRG